MLSDLGVPMDVFGPHSTRGAAVKMFKKFGLSSDHVAQLGRWKNLETFSKHYLRLGAAQVAAEKLGGFVHKVSQGNCAEPEWSRTPGTEQGPGGCDHKGGAQEHCEPAPPPRKRKQPPEGGSPQGGPKVFRFASPRQPPPASRSKGSPAKTDCT